MVDSRRKGSARSSFSGGGSGGGGGCCSSPRAGKRRQAPVPQQRHQPLSKFDGAGSSDESEYDTADEEFLQEPLAATGRAAPSGAMAQPFRQRRAFCWEGHWREDKALRVGFLESFETLGYPWWLMKIMRAAPGSTWIITDQTDRGHTLEFDTNSAVMNKLIVLAPILCWYGDSEESAESHIQAAFAPDLAPHSQRTWWASPYTLVIRDDWVESEKAAINKAMRGKTCWERTSLTYQPDEPLGCVGGSLLMEKVQYVQDLTPPEGIFSSQVMRREGPPPRPL